MDALTSRWVQSTNNVINPVAHVLKQLQQYSELRSWLTRGYFTANSLFYKIARRFLGLKEYEDEREDNKRQSIEQRIQPILDVFNVLKGPDPLEREIPNSYVQDKPVTYRQLWEQWQLKEITANVETNKVYQNLIDHAVFRLIHIMQTTMNVGDSTQSDEVLRRYERWIIEFMPDIEDRLINLRVQLEEKASSEWWQQEYLDESLDKNLETLAKRLELAVNAALLDRHTRIIFYEWHNRPDGLINDSQPYQRVPLSVQNILPRPITGQLFGIYYWSKTNNINAGDILSSFGYTNIGRDYLLNFHRLRKDLEGIRGPNVITMSGTSFLPDSVKWHIGGKLNITESQLITENTPRGILKPNQQSNDAIAQCKFYFEPKFEAKTGRPIRVSGISDKKRQLRLLTQELVGHDEAGKALGNILRNIETLARQEVLAKLPNEEQLWQDRKRALLLVNSYEQAEWVADELRRNWHDKHAQIYHLTRHTVLSDEAGDLAYEDKNGELQRTDIERFAKDTDGEILVAPMNAIGRGFNILNPHQKAAFGAILFLTRPYPHPQDTPAIAQELNRRVKDWLSDPNFEAWKRDGIYNKTLAVRKIAGDYWRDVESRRYYAELTDKPEWHMYPTRDIAATTVGYIIQAVGRLIRGGVPFHAYFLDAAWAPNTSSRRNDPEYPVDTIQTSLLVAMIEVLADYVHDSEIGRALYEPLFYALEQTENLDY